MARAVLAALVGCALAAPAAAQPRPPAPRKLLDAPVFTIRPQGALSAFVGEGVDVTIAWRPVGEAARYRVSLMNLADNTVVDAEVGGLRWEKRGLAPGRYQLTVIALDASGTEGALSEPLPLNVIEVRAVPPGADRPMPPMRGAYAAGTKFSVKDMHCEVSAAPIDDLLVLPENELRITRPGLATLRCAGIPGYLEKQVIIAPLRVVVQWPRVERGTTTIVHATFASAGFVGGKLDVQAFGDITLGEAKRTEHGLDIPVSVPPAATRGALVIGAGTFELARVELTLTDRPSPPELAAPPAADWKALDLGGQLGAFFPPTGAGDAPTIGHPMNAGDAVTAGALAGVRLGVFPIARVGLEGELSLIAGGYADESGVSTILSSRIQLAVRAVETGRFGLRLLAGAGAWSTLGEHGTSTRSSEGELHAGAALTVETSANLWLRFQVADLVTSARDNGYAHVIEAQLGLFTRFGRRDSF